MQTEAIITTLLKAAAFLKNPLQDTADRSLKDAYEAAKSYLRNRFGDGTEAAKALELATAKPESTVRRALLSEESVSANLAGDPEMKHLIEKLASLLPTSPSITWQTVQVSGRDNVVHLAGRDIIHTARHVQRNAITPDDRHISAAQRRKINALAGDLAERLAGEDERPYFAAVHRMLHGRYNVPSYLLLFREDYEDAVAYLRQQCAINRLHLRRRNPVTYQQDFFRAIHARREKLGWDKPQLHQFAFEKLGLKKPVTSLKELGPIQLKSLAEFLQRKVAVVSQ